jgi:hypothetical protein
MLLPICLLSQDKGKKQLDRFQFQISAGLTLSKRNVTEDILFEFYTQNEISKEEVVQPGYEIGVDIHYFVTRNLGFVAGVSISSLNLKTNLDLNNVAGYIVTTRQNLNYINVPILIFFKYPVKNFSPFIKTGIVNSRLIYATVKKEHSFNDSREDYTNVNRDPRYFKGNYFYMLCLGSDFKIMKSTFSFQISYQKGLRNVYNDEIEHSHFPMPIPIVDIPDNFKINYVTFSLSWII